MGHFRQSRVTDEHDASKSLIEQVLRRESTADKVVATDRAIQLLGDLRSPHHDGNMPCSKRIELVVMTPLPDEDHADGQAGADHARGRVETVGVHARQQHVEAAFRQGISLTSDHRKKERVGDVLT